MDHIKLTFSWKLFICKTLLSCKVVSLYYILYFLRHLFFYEYPLYSFQHEVLLSYNILAFPVALAWYSHSRLSFNPNRTFIPLLYQWLNIVTIATSMHQFQFFSKCSDINDDISWHYYYFKSKKGMIKVIKLL